MALLAAAWITLAGFQIARGDSITWFHFLFFLGLFITTESKPILLPRISLTVTFMIVVIATIVLSPAEVTIGAGLGVLGLLFTKEKPAALKLTFNAAQLGLAAGVGAEIYRHLGGPSVVSVANLEVILVSVAAATAVFFVVNTAAVSGAIVLSTGSRFLSTWAQSFSWMGATYAAFGAMGIVLAALYQLVGILSLPLLLVPLLVARGVFSAYEEVSSAYDSTIKTFVNAIEAKDAYTRGHSERVTEYAMLIARRIKMDEERASAFRYGALLHDVGKLAIKKRILTKPSSLEDDEFREIQKHPVLGAQIVKEVDFLRPALEGVLYHHERLDGSGYPEGLSGEVVPEFARIMAVADTYDAMTSNRAYRSARTHAEAIAELRRFAGTRYDPQFVEIFIKALEEEMEEGRVPTSYGFETVPGTAG